MAGSAPLTRFEIEQDVENRKHQLWEQEGRIFALAAEGMNQCKRGDGPEAVAITLQFLKAQIAHWETAYRALKQTEQALRGRNQP